MSNNILSLAKKVLIYYKISHSISDLRFQIFNQQNLSIIEINASWLLLLSRGVLIRRFWKYAPTIEDNTPAPVHCNLIEIKPQVFYKFDAYFNNPFFKEYLWGAAFGKCCNHNQLQRYFSTLEDII